MKALVLYDSLGGNTSKVAQRIHRTLQEADWVDSHLIKVEKVTELDFYEYDLLFLGSPVIAWGPTNAMRDLVMGRLRAYHGDRIRPSAPLRPGKFGVSFCTYSGTHIGVAEAIPLTKWFSSFLGHIGCQILDEWHIPGEFHGQEEANVAGRLGDIRGRPNEADLAEVENRVKGLLAGLDAWLKKT
ncbi:MAG: flavodoxin family protein [Deltaproteobacteria bacterium]|nr:flavodoxin family protein [Deltaproteobacteria bacterium]MBW1923499.1 flavodoxin family protein [Deltaproteobacteria bacterium]MBW1949890.1 flavodoxin family protein [Deltaproteobacteria bacterium]MBW2008494.1 flavodoxin family protein [Deltaproteobacteria bacterium]MBW2101385.1 flavodoxin family protein [Deltaproteobacteria bacterium]